MGFMEERTPLFVEEMWNLLLEAQESDLGVPPSLIEERNREMAAK